MRTEDYLTPELLAYMRAKASHFVPLQGESHRMVQRRYANWLEDEILYNDDLTGSPQSLRIAIVGHGAATRCILHYILGFDEQFIWKTVLENTSICPLPLQSRRLVPHLHKRHRPPPRPGREIAWAGRGMERKTGLEPATSSLGKDVLYQLSYFRLLSGAEGQNRTDDTSIFSAVLYLLSYLGASIYVNHTPPHCQVQLTSAKCSHTALTNYR